MGEVNWFLTALIGAILSIPFGILTNIITPILQNKLEKAALSTKTKRLQKLQEEYDEIKELHDKPALFTAKFAQHALSGLALVMISVAGAFFIILLEFMKNIYTASQSKLSLSFFEYVLIFSMLLFLMAGQSTIQKFIQKAIRLSKFEEYEKSTLSHVSALKSNKAKTK